MMFVGIRVGSAAVKSGATRIPPLKPLMDSVFGEGQDRVVTEEERTIGIVRSGKSYQSSPWVIKAHGKPTDRGRKR